MNLLLLAEFDFAAILPFALFGAIAIGAWVVVDMVFNNKSKTDSRLERMKSSNGKSSLVKDTAKKGIVEYLEKANPMSDALKPKSEKEINSLQQKLNEAGFRGEGGPAVITTLKLFAGIAGFFICGGVAILTKGFGVWTLIYTFGGAAIFLLMPETILKFIAGSRKQKLFLGLPDALDLMVVCVEAGLGMDQALRRVAEELESNQPIVSLEFNMCNQQLQMGSTRETVLTDLGERNGVDDLKTLASVMIQVDKFGTSVGQALRSQSDAMRVRRRQIAEEKASKTAVKMLFPLVLFIFPGIFVILVGPAAIKLVNELMPRMMGG